MLLWILHGFNYIVVYLCLTEFVNSTVPNELKTRGQMMNAVILSGISAIIGGYLGGVISTYTGLKLVFEACAIISFLTVFLFYGLTRFVKITAARES